MGWCWRGWGGYFWGGGMWLGVSPGAAVGTWGGAGGVGGTICGGVQCAADLRGGGVLGVVELRPDQRVETRDDWVDCVWDVRGAGVVGGSVVDVLDASGVCTGGGGAW